MLFKLSPDFRSSEITPKDVYLNRRRFLASLPVAGAALLTAPELRAAKLSAVKSPLSTDEKETPFKDATTYNNYYEFGTQKDQPAQFAHTLKTSPWKVSVEGAVAKPKVYDIEEILKLAPLEERI